MNTTAASKKMALRFIPSPIMAMSHPLTYVASKPLEVYQNELIKLKAKIQHESLGSYL
jgi:hypothetical protein